MIPLVDLQAQWAEVEDDIRPRIEDVLESQYFVGGDDVAGFSEEWANYVGADWCVPCNSGTDALELALQAESIGEGDRVVVPALTFAATAEAVVNVGAEPVIVDVTPTGAISPHALSRNAPDADAVIPVHLWGLPASMPDIESIADEHRLVVIEDCAQAHGGRYADGRRVGSRGNTCAWSFYPGKNLGAFGDAGAVTTDDHAVATTASSLADHGREGKHTHSYVGQNSRMDTLQAAVLRAKLPYLDRWVEQRDEAAMRYTERLSEVFDVPGRHLPYGSPVHAWHLYVVRHSERDRIVDGLNARDIGAGKHYPTTLPDQPAFEDYAGEHCPVARSLAARVFSLPLYPEITDDQQARVVSALKDTLESI